MALHPQLAEIMASPKEAGYGSGDWNTVSLEALRVAARQSYVPLGPAVRSRELSIPGPSGGSLVLRAYEPPQSPGPNSGLIFFSAGSYVVGELSGHTALCQQLAISAGCVVVTAELRLAPEHKFPAAILDAYAVTCWVHENAEDLGIDPARLAIGGESSGATIATAVCRLAKERRNPPLAFQLLLYPIVDLRPVTLAQLSLPGQVVADAPTGSSSDARARAQPITADSLLWPSALAKLATWYVADDAACDDPRCSPLLARNLIGVPPALIISAEHDVLRDQINAYAEALRAAHVPVTLSQYPGVTHGFMHLFALVDRGREALVECSGALRTAFARTS